MARHARLKGPRVGALTALLFGAVIVSALTVFGWQLSGGRMLAMTTPSMCPTVCVGSLVAVRPQVGPVHPGELVSFHPPGQTATFTHRVIKVEDNGSFTTKGDAESSNDPWLVPPSDIIGRVSFTLFGLGWWYRALPMVAAGTVVLLFTRRAYRLRNRRTFERMFGVLIITVPLLVLRPLVRGVLIETVPDPHRKGWFKALFVNTGLLPEHLSVPGVTAIPGIGASRLAWLHLPKSPTALVGVRQFAALPVWGWVLVAILVLSPILGFAIYRATRPVEVESTGVPVATAMALARLELPPIEVQSERVPFDIDDLADAPLWSPGVEPLQPLVAERSQLVPTEQIQEELMSVDPDRAEPIHAARIESEPLLVEPFQSVLDRNRPAHLAPASRRPAHAAPAHAAPAHAVPAHAAPAHAAPAHGAPKHAAPEQPEQILTEATATDDVLPMAARYSTNDLSHDEAQPPRGARRARRSGSEPLRSAGHRPPQAQELAQGSPRQSRRRDNWSVRWPK